MVMTVDLTTPGALWLLTYGRALRDSSQSALAMEHLLHTPVPDVVAAGVNEGVIAFVEWGIEREKNPACLAKAAYLRHGSSIPQGASLMLRAVTDTLLEGDVTGESHEDHDVCQGWPTGTPVPVVETTQEGALLDALVRSVSEQGEPDAPPSFVAACDVAMVLEGILGFRTSDDGAFEELLLAKSHAHGVALNELP